MSDIEERVSFCSSDAVCPYKRSRQRAWRAWPSDETCASPALVFARAPTVAAPDRAQSKPLREQLEVAGLDPERNGCPGARPRVSHANLPGPLDVACNRQR